MTSRNLCLHGVNVVSDFLYCRNLVGTVWANVGRVAQSVQRLATGWTVRGLNPGGGKILRTRPDRPWGPSSLLYNGYRVFPGGKERPGRDADPSPPSSAVVKKGQSYTSTSPMGRTACTEPQCLYKGALYLQLCVVNFRTPVGCTAWCYLSTGKHACVLHAISGSNLMLRPAKLRSLKPVSIYSVIYFMILAYNCPLFNMGARVLDESRTRRVE